MADAIALTNLFTNADDVQQFEAGATIFKEGDAGEVMYVLTEGNVDLMVQNKLIESLAPGAFLGEMALIDTKPRSATAVAKTSCKLAPITQRKFTMLVQHTPFFAIQLMRVMAERLRRMASRV